MKRRFRLVAPGDPTLPLARTSSGRGVLSLRSKRELGTSSIPVPKSADIHRHPQVSVVVSSPGWLEEDGSTEPGTGPTQLSGPRIAPRRSGVRVPLAPLQNLPAPSRLRALIGRPSSACQGGPSAHSTVGYHVERSFSACCAASQMKAPFHKWPSSSLLLLARSRSHCCPDPKRLPPCAGYAQAMAV
jgi:hypothetical protein